MSSKKADLTLTFGGVNVRGQLEQNLDTGASKWSPYVDAIIPFPAPNDSLESVYNPTTEKWEWKTNGDVFEKIRDSSFAMRKQYSTTDAIENQFFTDQYKNLNDAIDNNWTVYGVGTTAERGKPDYNSGVSWLRKQNTAGSSGAGSSANPQNPTPDKPPVTFEPIPYETDANGNSKVRLSYEDYYYPETLKSNTTQDVIKFTLKEVTKGTINPNLGQKTFTKTYEDRQGSVTLPIQPSITDSNIVEWSGFGLGPLGSFLAGQSLNIASSTDVAGLFSNAGNAVVDTLKELLGSQSSTAYQQQIKLALAEAASGTQGLLSRATGNVINENFELLFAGPQLRPFTFSFRMSPRSNEEAKQVRQIIRFFKQAMSVKTSSSNVFLKSPFVFDIRYLVNGSADHPSINRIKTCALLGCDVDYTPDQTYMTFNDEKRTMTSYGMTLRFSEIEPVFEKDYIDNNIPVDEIGY